jgi:Ca2+/Na+ antiporter
MDSLFVAGWLPGLVSTAGVMGLLLMLVWFPDGRFSPSWTRPAAIGLGVISLVVFSGLSGRLSLAEAEPWLLASTLACGVLVLTGRYRSSREAVERAQVLSLLRTAAFLLVYLVLLAAGTAFVPALRAWQSQGVERLFAFGPYLLAWLLLPWALLRLVRRSDLWREN